MRLCLAAIIVISAPQFAAAQRPGAPAAGKYGWHTTWEAGRAEARRTGKPLMVVFRCEP
jgi:hypothetical protein